MADVARECGSSRTEHLIWEVPHIQKRRRALIDRGAQQGWLIPQQELQLGRIIGAGTFGQTFEADWRGTRVRRCALCTAWMLCRRRHVEVTNRL